jgi:hypothetical protein
MLEWRKLQDKEHHVVRFHILEAVRMKMTVFWIDAPRNLVEFDRHLSGAYRLHHQGTSEMLVGFYQTAWHKNAEDIHLSSLPCSPVVLQRVTISQVQKFNILVAEQTKTLKAMAVLNGSQTEVCELQRTHSGWGPMNLQ